MRYNSLKWDCYQDKLKKSIYLTTWIEMSYENGVQVSRVISCRKSPRVDNRGSRPRVDSGDRVSRARVKSRTHGVSLNNVFGSNAVNSHIADVNQKPYFIKNLRRCQMSFGPLNLGHPYKCSIFFNYYIIFRKIFHTTLFLSFFL